MRRRGRGGDIVWGNRCERRACRARPLRPVLRGREEGEGQVFPEVEEGGKRHGQLSGGGIELCRERVLDQR